MISVILTKILAKTGIFDGMTQLLVYSDPIILLEWPSYNDWIIFTMTEIYYNDWDLIEIITMTEN